MMNAKTWRRMAPLLAAVFAVGMLLAVPSTAYAAKGVTRIVAAKTVTVNRDTPGINPWPKSLSVKLQKRITGTHYHSLAGWVKLYRWDPMAGENGAWDYETKKYGSSVTFKLPGRGKYKLYYAGTSTTRSATAYSGVYETIGLTVSAPVIEVEAIPATTQSWVTLKFDVNWNKEAVDGVLLWAEQAFIKDGTDYVSYIGFEHECVTTGTVEFNHKFENADMTGELWTWRRGYAGWWLRGEYVKTPAGVEGTYPIP